MQYISEKGFPFLAANAEELLAKWDPSARPAATKGTSRAAVAGGRLSTVAAHERHEARQAAAKEAAKEAAREAAKGKKSADKKRKKKAKERPPASLLEVETPSSRLGNVSLQFEEQAGRERERENRKQKKNKKT